MEIVPTRYCSRQRISLWSERKLEYLNTKKCFSRSARQAKRGKGDLAKKGISTHQFQRLELMTNEKTTSSSCFYLFKWTPEIRFLNPFADVGGQPRGNHPQNVNRTTSPVSFQFNQHLATLETPENPRRLHRRKLPRKNHHIHTFVHLIRLI
jgi:hypothetical protein